MTFFRLKKYDARQKLGSAWRTEECNMANVWVKIKFLPFAVSLKKIMSVSQKKDLWTQRGKEREEPRGQLWRIHTTPWGTLQNTGAQLALCEHLEGWGGGWSGAQEGGGNILYYVTYILIYYILYIHNYDWFMLLYSRNQHNTVKQFSSH